MEKLIIAAGKATPQVILDSNENILLIKGQSYPENAVQFYKPVLAWISEYIDCVENEVILKLHLRYLNTSSSKSMMDLIEIFNDAYNNRKNVKIHWYYDTNNESLLESGEDFKEDQDVPFEIIEVTE